MGTAGATQFCWAILGFLLLQGHNSQPTATQTSSSQGAFGSLSLTTEPISPNPGYIPSSETNSTSHVPSAGTPAPKKAAQAPMAASKPMTPRAGTADGLSPTWLGVTWAKPQMHTSGLGAGVPSSRRGGGTNGDTSQNVPPNSTTISLSTREDVTILPKPTSETVLTVAAFGVISFIVILVVVVIILVAVVSLRFKCRKSKESEDPQKPGSSGLSESGSTANGEKDSITLISMKNINMNNGKQSLSAEKVL
ncbi:endothelial cell-specific chemotaxis regulator isoform X2 [Saimiri boliviensis]|uniref:endothelial cell-specific chemotaxis regulator isoform X2 n=1 Tax=Saimiri boliviensis TaxID=27679 RepID=UPI000533F1B4|nr:endothelial cell-specific chemotaxis regulator isoform X2 [Saimiri boliviensis boliviensis]